MKVKILADVVCPECGNVFHMWPKKGYVTCTTEDCKLCDKHFEYPTVEVEEKK